MGYEWPPPRWGEYWAVFQRELPVLIQQKFYSWTSKDVLKGHLISCCYEPTMYPNYCLQVFKCYINYGVFFNSILAGQLSQSAHFSLQLPYNVLGLGRSANFLDHLFVGIPRPLGEKVCKTTVSMKTVLIFRVMFNYSYVQFSTVFRIMLDFTHSIVVLKARWCGGFQHVAFQLK